MSIVKNIGTIHRSTLLGELNMYKKYYTEALSKAKYPDEIDFYQKCLEVVEKEINMVNSGGNIGNISTF